MKWGSYINWFFFWELKPKFSSTRNVDEREFFQRKEEVCRISKSKCFPHKTERCQKVWVEAISLKAKSSCTYKTLIHSNPKEYNSRMQKVLLNTRTQEINSRIKKVSWNQSCYCFSEIQAPSMKFLLARFEWTPKSILYPFLFQSWFHTL